MRDSAGWRSLGGGKRGIVGRLVGGTGELEGEDVEELSQDIVETEGLEDESQEVGWRALQVPVSIRVR